LVNPLTGLGEGISAIRRRDSLFRIPVTRPDELGTLAGAFNRILGEMKELQYGRIVQESLLPGNPPIPPGYEVEQFRRTANDLAGDYHDILRLDDGRWAFFLGDVTGHGISAALAMAMAKATVDYQGLAGEAFPTRVMDQLNSLFYRELKPRQKFMTLGCLLLNPATHEVTFQNAGHPYPMIFRTQTGTIEELPLPSLPLGARRARKDEILKTTLSPRDAILLYSDGFVECTNARGKMFGYPRFLNLFRDLLAQGFTGADLIAGLDRSLDEFRTPGAYPDDVTLLLIQRMK
jgi:phosphoserine phosphatase RsbU/P